MTRNKRGEETSFPRELSGKLLSIHTDGENIDRVTLSHSQSAFCCILSEQSQNICCFLCVCLSVQGLTAKSWINLGLALTSPLRLYLCVFVCGAEGFVQVVDLKLQLVLKHRLHYEGVYHHDKIGTQLVLFHSLVFFVSFLT